MSESTRNGTILDALDERSCPASEKNKTIVRRFLEEGFNAHNVEILEELSAPDMVDHNPGPGLSLTLDGWKQGTAGMFAAFPDIHLHLEDEIAEGDRVSGRFTVHGTHQGEILGIPATGKEVTVAGILIIRLADGKIVERWEQVDAMGFMVQLGVIPPPGG